jgi:hypothetical protein
MNGVHELCIRINQTNAAVGLGEFALTLGVAVHVGTLPAGAVVMPVFSSIKVPFTATATIDIGSQTAPNLIAASADIAPATAASKWVAANGTGLGLLPDTTPIFALLGTVAATAGKGVIVVPYIIHKD